MDLITGQKLTHPAYMEKFIERGHTPIMEEEFINVFAYTSDGKHNGPKCSKCGFGVCHHCDPWGRKIPHCTS